MTSVESAAQALRTAIATEDADGHPPQKIGSSDDLVHRVTKAAAAHTPARMRVLERIPGNPIGIACRQIERGLKLNRRRGFDAPRRYDPP